MSSPTHHRAVALVLTVVLAIGLARTVGTAPRAPVTADAPLARAQPLDAATARAPDASAPSSAPGPVDPNTAGPDELVRLPGIGPTLARRILEARDAGVRFTRAEDLRVVRGIGPRVLARIAPHLALPDEPPQRDADDAAVDGPTDPASSAARPAR